MYFMNFSTVSDSIAFPSKISFPSAIYVRCHIQCYSDIFPRFHVIFTAHDGVLKCAAKFWMIPRRNFSVLLYINRYWYTAWPCCLRCFLFSIFCSSKWLTFLTYKNGGCKWPEIVFSHVMGSGKRRLNIRLDYVLSLAYTEGKPDLSYRLNKDDLNIYNNQRRVSGLVAYYVSLTKASVRQDL